MVKKNIFCSRCGKELENGQLFCPYCGEKVDINEEEKNKIAVEANKNETTDEQSEVVENTTNNKKVKSGDIVRYIFASFFGLIGFSGLFQRDIIN